jgi:hypothetical protein
MPRPTKQLHEWMTPSEHEKIDFAFRYLIDKEVVFDPKLPRNDMYRVLVEWATWALSTNDDQSKSEAKKLIDSMKGCWSTRESRKRHEDTKVYPLKMKKGMGEVLQKLVRTTGRSEAESLELLLTNFEVVRSGIQIEVEKKVGKELMTLRASQKRSKMKHDGSVGDIAIDPVEKELGKVKRQLASLRVIADARLWELCRYRVQFGFMNSWTMLTESQEMAVQEIFSSMKDGDDKRLVKEGRKVVVPNALVEIFPLPKIDVPEAGARFQADEQAAAEAQQEVEQPLMDESQAKQNGGLEVASDPPAVLEGAEYLTQKYAELKMKVLPRISSNVDQAILKDSMKSILRKNGLSSEEQIQRTLASYNSRIDNLGKKNQQSSAGSGAALPMVVGETPATPIAASFISKPVEANKTIAPRYQPITGPVELSEQVQNWGPKELPEQVALIMENVKIGAQIDESYVNQICWQYALFKHGEEDIVVFANKKKDSILERWQGR